MATPGPWGLRGSQIRADDGRGAHVATYQISRDDGFLIAAAPALRSALERLLACQPSPMAPFGRLYEACEAARTALALAAPQPPTIAERCRCINCNGDQCDTCWECSPGHKAAR